MDWSFQKMLVASLFMGGLLFAALVFQVLYWRYQRNSYHLVLCALCVASVLLLLAEKWRTAFGYSYDMHLLRLHLVVVMTYITCLLLVVFYVVYYQFKHKLRWVAVIATVLLAASLAPISYDGKSVVLFCVALVSVLSISIYGVINRWRSAWGSLLGMTMVTLLYLQSPDKFLEDKFALASLVVVALALLAVVNDMRQSRAQALASARMEAELLRRNLQPHFLMNSLMLVIEWIEQKPAAASAFVQALADELGMLVRFSSLQKITLDEEISLCERHLKIMAYRYAANYSLVITGSTAGIALPPAVIHAQIENAFSHNRLPLDAVFSLAIYRDKNRVRLELRSPRSTRPEQPVKAKPVSAGFGEHYISTRLQECFADRYRFESFADGDLWTSVIEFEERT